MPKQQNTIQEEALRRYDILPDELKQAMSSIVSAETIYGIGKKFGLNIEETGNLASVIGYIMLGMVPIKKFIDSIKDVTGVDNEKAAEIAREVNAKIFAAIREQLKETHGEKWDERAMAKEMRDQRSEAKETLPTALQTPSTPVEPERAAPKSPWEIKPDGFRKAEEIKSVIPPVKPELGIMNNELGGTAKIAEAEVKAEVKQEAKDKKQVPTPPEPPKTRETPQPAPAPKMSDVLKEIKPMGMMDELGLRIKELWKKPGVMETKKSAPPMGLPIMKEAEKLMQTPELNKPTTDSPAQIFQKENLSGQDRQPTTETPPTPKPELGIMNKELGIRETVKTVPQPPQPVSAPKPPQTPPAPQTQTPTQSKPQAPFQTPASTQKYAVDPYREPIE